VQIDKPTPIVKMTEKFRRSDDARARGDVAKRTFYLAQDSIRVEFYVPEDRLFNSYRVYSKTGRSHVVEMDPLAKPLDAIAQLEDFQALLAAEKDCTMVRWHAVQVLFTFTC
jgi:hypothetical protein